MNGRPDQQLSKVAFWLDFTIVFLSGAFVYPISGFGLGTEIPLRRRFQLSESQSQHRSTFRGLNVSFFILLGFSSFANRCLPRKKK